MIKNSNGITLVSLIITIAVMTIIASITVSTSMDRFEINKLNKMINDITFLKEKVSNYYLQYKELPVVKADNNNYIEYTNIQFNVDENDNERYYIIDLEAMGDIALNYGKEGFENSNNSEDLYIINEKTHNIYYVRGIEWKGEYYHSNIKENQSNNSTKDNVPPTTPQMNIISGEKYIDEDDKELYTTDVKIEIIPGKDNWSGVNRTIYTINDEEEIDITSLESNILVLTEEMEYNIVVKTYDNEENYSENNMYIKIEIPIQEEIINGNVLENELNINQIQ